MIGLSDVAAAAGNLYSTTVGGGLADLRRMPATVIDRGPQRTVSRYESDRRRRGAPVLLVWGTRDRMVPHTGARVVLGALPATRVELIEGCGHSPQLEATGALLELLLEFPG